MNTRSLAVLLAAASLLAPPAVPAATLQDLLPGTFTYDPSIPTPRSVLGWDVGTWHVRHDQLVDYMRALAAASDRVHLEETGRTWEERPLLLLTISAPGNLARLDALREQHLALTRPGSDHPPLDAMPAVVYLGYSVHGNEASGANAALVVAYHLAAARGDAIDTLLRHTIILLDPALNPDGLARFAHWANMHRGKHPIADPQHREHVEPWPSGRTNHYWFDLNRDWILLQHPESRARVAAFHRWKPNVLGDFHEMGSDATYFFQPGVPSRTHPLTPRDNVELTARIATYHARALDARGALYYTRESFDDFYYGKGSTYPDANGGVGILFEQASARGHRRASVNGTFDFTFAIRNQVTTSWSTLEAARDLRVDLLRYQETFFRSALEAARAQKHRALLFGNPYDRGATTRLLDVFLGHDIEVRALARPVRAGDRTFRPGTAYAIPYDQPQYRLVEALTETRTHFPDSLFYDVSTWTLPLAYNVPYATADRLSAGDLGARVTQAALPAGTPPAADAYAYAFSWREYYAPRALQRLLAAGVRARVAFEPFRAHTAGGNVDLGRGAIVVPLGIQDVSPDRVRRLLEDAARDDAVDVHTLDTGLTPAGVDLGSPSLRPLDPVHPAVLVGRGVSSYQAGEMWFLLDRKMDIEVTLLDVERLGSVDLDDYTHLILVNAGGPAIDDRGVQALREWLDAGGVLVTLQGAARWAREHELVDVTFVDDAPADSSAGEREAAQPAKRYDYATRERRENAHIISGAILRADVDVTHPLGFGYGGERTLPVFRNGRRFLRPSTDPYATVVAYAKEPVWSGWVSSRNLEKLRGTASVVTQRQGRGLVVVMMDDPDFRASWYGTNKLLLNALFFGRALARRGR